MHDGFTLLVIVVAFALIFDYINGFHDTANAIATVVSTNVLPPRTAIMLAAVFNFAGALWGTAVAKQIGSGIVDPTLITQTVVASALIGAIVWNLITWWFGIPSSSSHALVGGIVGATFSYRCTALTGDAYDKLSLGNILQSPGMVTTVKFLVISPLIGLFGGFTIMLILYWIFQKTSPSKISKWFKSMQLVSASAMALSHGSNDAQKAMGIITMGLVSYYSVIHKAGGIVPDWMHWKEYLADPKHQAGVPYWVILSCACAMALGTAAGGWRIMKTMGHKIIKLKPIHGFAAETAAAITILCSAHFFKAPVSTTHVISSSIMGVGASKRVSAVRWGVAGNILVAWVLTIPVSALIAGLVYLALHTIMGD